MPQSAIDWILVIVAGFAMGYVLTPTQHVDEHGRKISKKEYNRIERGE